MKLKRLKHHDLIYTVIYRDNGLEWYYVPGPHGRLCVCVADERDIASGLLTNTAELDRRQDLPDGKNGAGAQNELHFYRNKFCAPAPFFLSNFQKPSPTPSPLSTPSSSLFKY
ncbi:unnamed protein product [Moneuplotes crassus]|uniref:Uncharacterized protein n=1 Tax=Euplotes crassus TaxID=5936 RepID=A0AAD1Y5G1_EUPCR|nr:unnamed protein product [Moneuplotes crassus]